ncbi:MAG: hypothetical protein JSV42_13670 [Chloroflexota bacterium]|nr:MAG: hypothetical protein JSV42_13670 [Chloroflexota bacterium]
MNDQLDWLLGSDEPWTRYRTFLDLLDLPVDSSLVQDARREMIDHPSVRRIVDELANWPGYALKRHNDAKHPLYKLSTLADFGLESTDSGIQQVIDKIRAHQSPQGAYETPILIPEAFGGSGREMWSWVLCDAPTLLYCMLAMEKGEDDSVDRAVEHLADLVAENGWRCTASPDLGNFKGPGRKADPCPMANVYALKALALTDRYKSGEAVRLSTEMLLTHWQRRKERKYFLFGMGTDFAKLKYPFVWYDILHVIDVLSKFPWVHADPRFFEMVAVIIAQADGDGLYTASSMYQAWKGWSFADKKQPSPWITFLVLRILKRSGQFVPTL